MARNYKKQQEGLTVVPKTTTASDTQGELEVLTSDGKIRYHNGTTNSPVVTEAHTATLTNKSIDADVNTITNIDNNEIKALAGIDATKIADGSVTNIEFQYINTVTSNVQTQLDGKASSTLTNAHILVGNGSNVATDVAVSGDVTIDNTGNVQIVAGAIVNADINAAAAIDATKIADGSVTSTEFQYINSLTSNAQTQLDSKVAGPASATNNAVARYDLTTGKLIKDSLVTIGDTGIAAGLTGLTSSGTVDSTGTLQVSGALNASITTDSTSTGANATVPAPATSILRLTNASLTSIDMISSPTTGRIITLSNQTGAAILINNDTGATAANRIYTGTGANLTLLNQASIVLEYDATASRWLAVGINSSSASSTISSNLISNLGIAASVGSSAMTISIVTAAGATPTVGDKVSVGFRNSTAGTGQYSLVDITSSISTTISSGSTAGQANGVAAYIYVYLINNAGTAEIAWSRSLYDEGSLITTTAEGGAGAADSAATIYSTTARTNVPLRLIGRLLNTQTTAGTWAAVPSEISLVPFITHPVMARYSSAAGQSISNGAASIINFDSKSFDSHNAVTTGASWKFTAPVNGKYLIDSSIRYASASFSVNNNEDLYLFKNGSNASILISLANSATATAAPGVTGGDIIDLVAGDYIDIRTAHGETTARSLQASSVYVHVAIQQIG